MHCAVLTAGVEYIVINELYQSYIKLKQLLKMSKFMIH